MLRFIVILAAAGLLGAPASAAAEAELDFDPRTTTSASDDAVVITGGSETLDLEISWRFFFGASAFDFDVSSPQGFDNQAGTDCDETSTPPAATDFDCTTPDVTEVTGSPVDDSINASCLGRKLTSAILTVHSGDGGDDVSSSCGATIDLGSGNDAASMRAGNSTVNGGDGADDIGGGINSDRLRGDAGSDRLRGNSSSDVLEGGEGNDQLDGGLANDTLQGGAGRDLLVGGLGTDVIDGAASVDTVSYEDRDGAAVLAISLNGAADDGAAGENDRIDGSVENVIASPGMDVITGNDGFNEIDGGDGGDVIDPGGATDFVDAGAGNDRVRARDGFPDRVSCGPGDDLAITDAFDVASDCEALQSSRELMPDVDNDGIPAPADCADGDPAIRPGARDVADNGIDENCDGADSINPDRDNDGAARPTDCNDNDPRVRPGLPDKPGNGLDENCEGGDAAFPRIVTPVQSGFLAFAAFTRVTKLRVLDVPAGAVIELRCTGGKAGGCFRRVLRRKSPQGASVVNVRDLVRRNRFRVRAVLELRVLHESMIGKVVRFTMRHKRKVPVSRTLCVRPGGSPQPRC